MTTYYVNTSTGSDTYTATQAQNPDTPWKTIQKAANTVPTPSSESHTVQIADGDYGERVTVNTNPGFSDAVRIIYRGTSGSPAYDGPVKVQGFNVYEPYIKLDGLTLQPVSTGDPAGRCVAIDSVDYVTVDNCYGYYAPNSGIMAWNCDYITVQNSKWYRICGAFFDMYGSNNTFINNEMWGGLAYHPTLGTTGTPDGFFIRTGSGHTFRQNYYHGFVYTGDNEGYAPHVDCVQFASGDTISDCLFERNFFDNAEWHGSNDYCKGFEVEGNISNITIKNNIVRAHVGIGMWDNHSFTFSNWTIVNNTWIAPQAGYCTVGSNCWPLAILLNDCPNSIIKNNITIDWKWAHIYLAGTTEVTEDHVDYNLAWMRDNSSIPTGDGNNLYSSAKTHDKWATDPKLEDDLGTDAIDFKLQSNSPCRDTGVTISGVVNDYDGISRPQGNAFDIGAYEYQGSAQSIKMVWS